MFNSPRFKRQLFEQIEHTVVMCDNPDCNYEVPADNVQRTYQEKIAQLLPYLNKPCLICGENLLTHHDFLLYAKTQKVVAWLNKYFSWLTWFKSDKAWAKRTSVFVHTHKEITLTDEPVIKPSTKNSKFYGKGRN